MRILEEFKIKKLKKFSQLILLDQRAFVTDSCDTIFPTHQIRSQAIFEWFPFIESIFDELLQLNLNESELRFAKVEDPSNFLSGFYDFNFSKVLFKNKEQILWSIYDFTSLYKDFQQYQQRLNELEIHKQLRKSNEAITSSSNGTKNNNGVISKQYQHIVIETLDSLENILDCIPLSLNSNFATADVAYLAQLKISIDLLQNIIQEFENFITTFPQEYAYSTKQEFPVRQFYFQILSKTKEIQLFHKKNFNYTIVDSLPLNVVGLPSSFAQILYYLTAHSLKFNQVTDIELNINFTATQNKKGIIELELIEKLTNTPSFNLQNDQQNKKEIALSYQLSILKKLITSLGGNILVKTQEKNNSITITCTLCIEQLIEMV